MSVTIKEVAEAAGVSPKTVSRVLNNEAYVRPAVRAAVEQVIATLGYKPNMAARSLASARSYLIGLAVDDPTWSAYAAGIQLGAIKRCRERNYHLVIETADANQPESEAAMIRGIAPLQLEGLIVVPPLCTAPGLLDRIEAIGLPYVRIAPGEDPGRSGFVEIDERRAGYEVTTHLIGLGHRDIGFIEGIADHAATPRRRAGFLAAMHDAGLPVRAGRIQPGAFTFQSGLEGGLALLRDPADRPTAIFASNDDTAMGVLAAAGRLDIAVANAGVCSIQRWDEVTPELWDTVIGVNLTGVWNTCTAAVPHLLESGGGSMILISSTAGLKGQPFLTPYVASKHGLVGIMRSLANELAARNIRVNSLHPTGVDTPMLNAMTGLTERIEASPDVGSLFLNSLPVDLVRPEDVSHAVLFLASDESRYVTGLTMTVDAGASAR